LPVIVKAFDDLRQEQMVSQILAAFHNILREARVPVYIRPYDIIATEKGGTGGLIEAVPDTVSIHSLKTHDPSFTTLDDFFIRHFGRGSKNTVGYKRARKAFVESMAGYAVVCFLLQIKDRHNGNILLDNQGHIVHIDWGFVLASSPGKNLNFEAAPFKLTSEFVELMGGSRSASFQRFRRLAAHAFLEVRKRREEIILLVEMVSVGNGDLPCFRNRPAIAIAALRERFRPDLVTDSEVASYMDDLINQSLGSSSTYWYDKYQMSCVGVKA
jgi:phosphatidylinositol kinase/protein kinase (PI-3  family)